MSRGRVLLVGAGPGDADLLTVKALRALRTADVVLYDALVPAAIYELARSGARLVPTGKRGGCASTPQAFIEQLMIREARAGQVVVRLKGGDPFIFGRGGEELAALREAGIAVEVIPGITAGLAAAASTGIALTHRERAHGVAFVSGHPAEGESEPDWRALVASGCTLVVYMGVARVEALVATLLASGARPGLPVAVIADASRTSECVLHARLRDLPRAMARSGLGSPAVIIAGETAGIACATGAATLPHVSTGTHPRIG